MRALTAPLCLFFALFFVFGSCEKELPIELPNGIPDVVIINNQISIKLPVDSVLLSCAVKDDDTSISYLWTKLTGDSVIIEHADSLFTWIKGLKEGSYSFKFTVSDNEGGVGQDTVFIIVEGPEPVHNTTDIAIRPNNNPTEVHLFGNALGTIDQTDPNAPELLGGSGTYEGSPVDIRALLKFDLSEIPEGATIESAHLLLYSNPTPLNGHDHLANSGTNNALYVERVLEAWDVENINWLNQPAAASENRVLVPHTDSAFKDVDVDVTNLVSSMVENNENYGFLIKLKTEASYNFRIFCSSKYADESKHPKLVVSYY